LRRFRPRPISMAPTIPQTRLRRLRLRCLLVLFQRKHSMGCAWSDFQDNGKPTSYGAIDFQNHTSTSWAGGNDLAGVYVLFGPRTFSETLNQTFQRLVSFNKMHLIGDVGDAAVCVDSSGSCLNQIPWIFLQLFHTQGDCGASLCYLDDLKLDGSPIARISDGWFTRRQPCL